MKLRRAFNSLLTKVALTVLGFIVQCCFALEFESSTDWFHTCGNRPMEPLRISAEQCPHGTWISKSLESGCVCMHGLWAITSKSCDEEPNIFFGKGHCFQIPPEAQHITFLGNVTSNLSFLTNGKNSRVFKQFHDFIEIPNHSKNVEGKPSNQTVIQIIPNGKLPHRKQHFLLELSGQEFPIMYSPSYVAARKYVCIPLDQRDHNHDVSNEDEALVTFHKLRMRFKTLRIVNDCPPGAVYLDREKLRDRVSASVLKIGEGIGVNSGRTIKNSISCSLECENNEIFSRSKRAAANKAKPTPKPKTKPGTMTANPAQQAENITLSEERKRAINEETFRVIRTEVLFILDREKPPKYFNSIWQLLERAKETFLRVCPEPEISRFLVNSLLRVFRFIYLHTLDRNPHADAKDDRAQSSRITQALNTCMNEASPIQFEYKMQKVQGTCISKNETVESPPVAEGTEPGNGSALPSYKEVKYCNCVSQLDTVNFNFTKNASNPNENIKLNSGQATIPQQYGFSILSQAEKVGSSHFRDLPTETAWKVIEFAHYFCAKNFKSNPADHSAMMMKFESFFNPDVIFRWNHPTPQSNDTWRTLYQTFDLDKFTKAVDTCVASAKHVSDYPVWILRPSLHAVSRRKRSTVPKTLPEGQAVCIEDAEDMHRFTTDSLTQCYDEFNDIGNYLD